MDIVPPKKKSTESLNDPKSLNSDKRGRGSRTRRRRTLILTTSSAGLRRQLVKIFHMKSHIWNLFQYFSPMSNNSGREENEIAFLINFDLWKASSHFTFCQYDIYRVVQNYWYCEGKCGWSICFIDAMPSKSYMSFFFHKNNTLLHENSINIVQNFEKSCQ